MLFPLLSRPEMSRGHTRNSDLGLLTGLGFRTNWKSVHRHKQIKGGTSYQYHNDAVYQISSVTIYCLKCSIILQFMKRVKDVHQLYYS